MGNVLEWLFLLCCLRTYVTGDSCVTGSLQPVVGLIGHDVTLPCHLDPLLDVSGLTIEWSKLNGISHMLVHVRRNGKDVSNANPAYKKRTALFEGELQNGNVSLKLSRVGISDEGMYMCLLPSLNGLVKMAMIELKIGNSSMTGSLQPVVGLIGHDVILSCHLEPPLDVSGLTIEWSKLNGIQHGLVHSRRNGRDVRNTNPFYKNRIALFEGELEKGNVSLKLSRVGISNEGMYMCLLSSLNGLVKKAEIELKIATVSKPQVSVVGLVDGGVVLQCESGGWYPKPEVEWLDSEGHVLPAYENISNPTSRYDVKMKMTVAGKGRFTCRVGLLDFNQTREAYIDITDEIFQSSSSGRDIGISVSVVMVIFFIFILTIGVVAVILYRRNVAGSKVPIQDQQENLLNSIHVKPNGGGNQLNSQTPRTENTQEDGTDQNLPTTTP